MKLKQSYPNFTDAIQANPVYDKNKWVDAAKVIFDYTRKDVDFDRAFSFVTKDWNVAEQKAFKEWVKFYQEQAHMKYKTAKAYYENNQPGYFLPMPKVHVNDPIPSPEPNFAQIELDRTAAEQQARAAKEKREAAELQRRKIIARLQAARKLLTSDDGKNFAGDSWTKLLDALNELEKQFHTAAKSASASFCEDLIVRKANQFIKSGNPHHAEFMFKIAQGLPGAALPADPSASVPQGGALGNNTILPAAAPSLDGPAAQKSEEGIKRFLNLINGDDGDDGADESNADDEIGDDETDNDFEDDVEIDRHDADDPIVVEAQDAGIPIAEPEAKPAAVSPEKPAPAAQGAKAPPETDLEVTDQDSEKHDEQPNKGDLKPVLNAPPAANKDFDNLIDAAFATLKVSDIVHRLEELGRIFKNREIARQLSVVDMMMDKLGLSSFFPTLAEATRSALESNQYCLTRIEEVKNKLSGALDSSGKSLHDMGQQHSINNQQPDSDLVGPDNETPGENDELLDLVKTNLQSEEMKEKAKKDLRKNQEEKDLIEKGEKENSNVESVDKDLDAAPAKSKTPAASPAQARSAPPAPAAPSPPIKAPLPQ